LRAFSPESAECGNKAWRKGTFVTGKKARKTSIRFWIISDFIDLRKNDMVENL
jgi:hypothetical protein